MRQEEPENQWERDAAHETEYDGPAAAPPVPIDPAIWPELLDGLDYQSRKWWILNTETGDWEPLPNFQVDDVLYGLGLGEKPRYYHVDELTAIKSREPISVGHHRVADPIREYVKKLLWKRDTEATKRIHDPEKRKHQEQVVNKSREREERREAAAARKRWREQKRPRKKPLPPPPQMDLEL